MKIIPVTEIIVPENRQRRTFDPEGLAELMHSIESKGLLHPVVLRADGKTLLSGERRLRAIKLLFAANGRFECGGLPFSYEQGLIPYTPMSILTSIELEEAELEENMIRKDLTWQERTSALARLHLLRVKQNGAQTQTKTAEEFFGISLEGAPSREITAVRDAVIINKYLADPEVALAGSAKEALKIIEKKAAEKHRALLAKEFVGRPMEHQIHCGDSFKLIRSIPERSIDIILTDPPYGIEADKFGDQADAQHRYIDSIDYAFDCYSMVAEEASRICKSSAFIFMFCDIRNWFALREKFDNSWTVWSTPLIWNKQNGMLPVPEKGPRRNYEAIIYAYRGARSWLATGVSDVLEEPGLAKPLFGAQKPPALYASLLSRVSQPGDVVLDPFAGTCPVVAAARAHSCRAIAFEADEAKVNYGLVNYAAD